MGTKTRTRQVPPAPQPANPAVPAHGVMVTLTHGSRSWTTTGSKLALALVHVSGHPSDRLYHRVEGLFQQLCDATLVETPTDVARILGEKPEPVEVSLAGLTIKYGRWTYSGEAVARLLRLVSHLDQGVDVIADGNNATLILEGIGDVATALATADGGEGLGGAGTWLLEWLMKYVHGLPVATASFRYEGAAKDCVVVITAPAGESKAVA